MEDEQAEDHGGDEAAPDPEPEVEHSLDEVEPELLATFTEIGIVETRRAIEAILLVATDPTPASLLAQLIEVPVEHVELLCHALADSYEEANHGFQLVKVAGGWRFQTHPDMAPYVERFAMDGQSSKLSNAALETLAIVAYKQPISRAQVSAIRGVNVDAVLRTLVQRGYVDEVGRDTGAGQAVLFGTTPVFLERLGINTVADLPALGDFVPSAEVVEALEQTLKVDLDPDLVTDGDDDGPVRPSAPPDPSDATGDAGEDGSTDDDADDDADRDAADAEAPVAEVAGPDVGDPAVGGQDPEGEHPVPVEAVAESQPPRPEAEAAAIVVAPEVADEAAAMADEPAEVEVEPEAGASVEPELSAEAEAGPEAEVAVEDPGPAEFRREIEPPTTSIGAAADLEVPAAAEPPTVHGESEAAPVAAPPENERAAEQTEEPVTATPEPAVVAPGEVVVDAEASPKSGADRADGPLGPGGEPPGQSVDGGQPGVAGAPPAPVAGDPRIGDPAAHGAATGSAGQPGPDRGPEHGSGTEHPPAAQPDPAAQAVRPDPSGGHRGFGTGPAGGPGRSSGQPTEPGHEPADTLDGPTGSSGPGVGPGLAGPADPAVPPSEGPGPDLRAEPVVDLRPSIDLTRPPSPANGIGSDPDGWSPGGADS